MIYQSKHNLKISVFILLSFVFALTVQQFDLYKGNAAHLTHSIKFFDDNKLQYDWISNQTHHLPLFSNLHFYFIKFFSNKIIHLIHFILLLTCALFIFLICKHLFSNLEKKNYYLLWFALFTFIYHENSFFSGVAGQSVIDAGYQPASFGVLFFIGIYLYLKEKELLSIFFVCLAASFHPTYILHSGFFITGILFFNLNNKDYKNFIKVLISYTLLILPITLFVVLNFLTLEKQIIIEGQKILIDRVKHHADIHYWLTSKDFISLISYLFALFLTRFNSRFFIFFLIFGLCSVSITFLQFFLNNNSLALAFPWRSSVFLIPISSMIIISYFVNKISFNETKTNLYILFLILFSYIFFYTKSHYIKNLNQQFDKNLLLVKKIKNHYYSIDRLLIPANLGYVRMNSGIPIFIDWKHHAFKYDEAIKWKQRLSLVNDFYSETSHDTQSIQLRRIEKIEDISHVLLEKSKLFNKCNNLINHDTFALVSVKECYYEK